MTERREAVARAIDDVINDGLDAWFGGRWESPDWTRVIDRAADAALAALDAEPTEAEIVAARKMWFRLPDDMTADECMRRVLIAARTARQGGQG